VTAPQSMSILRATSASAPAPPRLAWSGPYLFANEAGQRPYFVYTPTQYQLGTSVSLVVILHGCSQTPRGVAVATQWNDLAEEHNFIAVYPGQTLAVSPDAITGPTDTPNPPTTRAVSRRETGSTHAGRTATATTAGTGSCPTTSAAVPANRRSSPASRRR
jgi:poly(3-hydroxybutyrate) depolymerase